MVLLYEQTQTGVADQNDYATTFASVFSSGYTLSGITKVTIYLKKSGSPTGTVKAGLWQGSALPQSPTQESSNTLDVSTITGSFVGYDFTFPGSVTLSGSFKIGLTFSGFNNLNFVYFSLSSDTLANRSSERTTGSNAWESMRPQCFTMEVYGSEPSTGTRLPPPPLIARF